MTKILMRRGKGLRTVNLPKAPSKFSAEADRIVTSKTPVRRLQRRDPSNAMTDPRIANKFTNNPNPKYQPTGVFSGEPPLGQSTPGATVIRRPNPKPPSTRNRGKVLKRQPTRWRRGRLS